MDHSPQVAINGFAIFGAATALFSGDTISGAKGAGLMINTAAAVGDLPVLSNNAPMGHVR